MLVNPSSQGVENDLLGSSLNWNPLTSEVSQRLPSTPLTLHEHLSSGASSCIVSLHPLFHVSWPSTVISKYFGHRLVFFLFVFSIFLF